MVTWQFCVLVTLSLSNLRSNNRVGDFMKFLICLFACVILLVLICFKFVLHVFTKMLELYSMCLLKCSRVTRFVGTLFWVRDLMWLSSNSTCSQPYKWIVNTWLNWSFQRPFIIKMGEHQQQFPPKMDAIKDGAFSLFLIFGHTWNNLVWLLRLRV